MILEDLYRLLQSGHVQAQGIVDTLEQPLIVLDQVMCVVTANPAYLKAFKADRDQTIGHNLFSLGNGRWDIPELRQLFDGVIPKATAIVDFEVSGAFPEIGAGTYLITARRLNHPDDNSQQIMVAFNDVSKRRREDEARDILMSETRHRLNNMFAVVTALANQTSTEGRSASEYRKAFLGRLQSLQVAQELTLTEMQVVELQTLIERVLKAHAHRIKIEPGPFAKLTCSQVQPFGLVLNEMATNSLKYGSLSVPQGSVRIRWTVDHDGEQRMVSFVWLEEGGPPASQPSHKGFGTDLIERSVDGLYGDVELAYEQSGFRACVRFPAKVISDGRSPAPSEPDRRSR